MRINALLKILNSRLQKDKICKDFNIPSKLKTVWEKFIYLKYLILEFWDKQYSLFVCREIVGIYYAVDFYLLVNGKKR